MFGISTYADAPYASLAVTGNVYSVSVSETATGTDSVSALAIFTPFVSETGTALDTVSALMSFVSSVSETEIGRAHV